MKTMLSLLFVVGLSAASCSRDTTEVTPVPKKSVSWTVDGITVNTENYLAGTGSTGQLPDLTVRVGGRVFREGRIVADVELEVPPVVGTYVFGPTSPAWATYEADGARYEAGTAPGGTTALGMGTITVTETSDHHLAGTFTFTGIERTSGVAKTISNGQFFVPE